MPAGLGFATQWQLMLQLIDRMQGMGLEALPFIGDAAYGDVAEFRRQINDRLRPLSVGGHVHNGGVGSGHWTGAP